VLVVQVDNFSVQLAPWSEPGPAQNEQRERARETFVDPLLDPSTYPGGRVPGFTREGDEEPQA
jgi:hypothetical protein